MNPAKTIIGVAGASGAGKSRFAELLHHRLQKKYPGTGIAILHEDSYYRRQSDKSLEERMQINYDHPDALEHELLIGHLRSLRSGNPVQVPVYDYASHNRCSHTELLEAPRILILEGILIFNDPGIRGLLDLAIFMDVPLDICLMRRLRRDIEQRGRTLDSVLHQYEASVRPSYFRYVEPTRRFADLIIPRGGENEAAREVLFSYLDGVMRKD